MSTPSGPSGASRSMRSPLPFSLLISAIILALVPLVLLPILAQLLPAFDTSHLVSQPSPFSLLSSSSDTQLQPQVLSGLSAYSTSSSTIRWDAIHFAAIARDGYTHEQQVAFQPGWPEVMAAAGWAVRRVAKVVGDSIGRPAMGGSSSENWALEVGAVGVNLLARIGAAVFLYLLTVRFTSSSFARVSTAFYILTPTPAVLAAPNTEPTYALFTFAGLYLASVGWVWAAAVPLAMATSVRATGVFSALPLAVVGVFGDKMSMRLSRLIPRAAWTAIPCVLTVAPFAAFQYYTYTSLCTGPSQRPWCTSRLPLSYSFVQVEYWNNGLFKYWKPDQSPNFLIAGPVLAVSLRGTITYLRTYLSTLSSIPTSTFTRSPTPRHMYDNPLLLPFHLHHLLLTLLLIFSSHTQIALRVASGDPVVWWNVTAMAFDWDRRAEGEREGTVAMRSWGRVWVWWSVLWGAVSIVLWAGHYPPA